MTNPTSSKPVLLAEYMAGIWVRMLRRNAAVAAEASRKMAAGDFDIRIGVDGLHTAPLVYI